MVRLTRSFVLCCLVLGTVLAVAAPAQAYHLGGQRWPGSPARITYYDATPASYHWSVAQAAKAWNTSGVRVRFVKVSSRSRARLVIRRGHGLSGGEGYANIGYARGATIELVKGSTDKWTLTGVAAHEMGHILGLEHVAHRCAVMTPGTYVSCNPEWPPHLWQWRCRVLQRDDLNGARARYGGHVKLRHSMWCDKGPKASAVSSIAVTQLTSDPEKVARVTVRLPASHVKSVGVLRRQGTCPTGPNDPDAHVSGTVSGKPGASVSITDTTLTALPAGTYCYRAWSWDDWDRAGGARSVNLSYTPPPVPVSDVVAVAQNTLTSPPLGQDPVYVDATVNVPSLSWINGADVLMKQGSCPADSFDGTYLGIASPGAGVHVTYGTDVPAAGSWCVAAFTFDGSLRSAVAGATYTFSYASPPP